MRPVFSVIIPAYNESEALALTLSRLHEVMRGFGEPFEIVVVDDGSRDETWQVIEGQHQRISEVRGLRLSRNFGKENAICAGLDAARGQAVILMDADLQHPPEIIPEMVAKWRKGYRIVEGRKRSRGKESLPSKLAARAFYYLLGSLSSFELEGASDFKLLDRKVLEAWKQLGERNVFFRGMAEWVGFQRTSVDFEVADRVAGASTWSRLELFGLALMAITAFSSVPLRVVTFVGVVFMFLAALLGAQTLYLKLTGGAFTGFTTVILLILITASLLMLALGVIGEYVARIYEEVKFRPRYIIGQRTPNSPESRDKQRTDTADSPARGAA